MCVKYLMSFLVCGVVCLMCLMFVCVVCDIVFVMCLMCVCVSFEG